MYGVKYEIHFKYTSFLNFFVFKGDMNLKYGSTIFSSPVRKYRKSYCSHPGVGVSVGVAQMLKFLFKVFIRLYLLNMLMDRVDTLHIDRYWSEVLCCTIMTHLSDLDVKVTDLEILC